MLTTADFSEKRKDDKWILSAFASDLRYQFAAAFDLKSHRTGKILRANRALVEKDDEGDILVWHYIVADETLAIPVHILIFND